MSGSRKIFYWDSNVYLAWLLEEPCYLPWLPSIRAVADANFRSENVIVTSTITLIEVMSFKLTVQQENKFQRSFDGYRHKLVEVGPTVALRSREYREKFVGEPRQLLVPDAIHLATATIEGANELHTFDDGKRKGTDENHENVKTVSLLGLDGSDRIHKLKINKPFVAPPPADLFRNADGG